MTSAKFWDPPHQRVEDPNLSSLNFPCLWNHQYTSFNELLCLEKDGKCYHYSEVGFVCRRADLLSASSWSRLAPWRGLCCRRTQPRQVGRLAGWEISIDSRRQKLAILLNVRVRPSVLPPLPLLSPPFPVVPAALTLYVPSVAKSGGQTLLKITSFPFWRSSYARRGRGRTDGRTNEQWQRLAISASVLVVFLTLDCRRCTLPSSRCAPLYYSRFPPRASVA